MRPAASGAAPGARPTGAPGARMPMRPGQPMRPGAPMRPGVPPSRPGFPPRPGPRPMRPGGPGMAPSVAPPPMAEPASKPIYERKPAARARPTLAKRSKKGMLHPARGPRWQIDAQHEELVAAPPPRPPREISRSPRVLPSVTRWRKFDVRAGDRSEGPAGLRILHRSTRRWTYRRHQPGGIIQRRCRAFEEEAVQDVGYRRKRRKTAVAPPVVTVMYVDHGKTSLLYADWRASGGNRLAWSMQHIGASMVSTDGRRISFVDTLATGAHVMRARGAKVTGHCRAGGGGGRPRYAADDGGHRSRHERCPSLLSPTRSTSRKRSRSANDNSPIGITPEEWALGARTP